MPAEVNISVGSLRGTSGLEATTSCSLRRKYSRKLVRISFAEVMTRKPLRAEVGRERSKRPTNPGKRFYPQALDVSSTEASRPLTSTSRGLHPRAASDHLDSVPMTRHPPRDPVVEADLAAAAAHHQAGRLAQAEAGYRGLLSRSPK